jgi:hypothetical protein
MLKRFRLALLVSMFGCLVGLYDIFELTYYVGSIMMINLIDYVMSI